MMAAAFGYAGAQTKLAGAKLIAMPADTACKEACINRRPNK